MQLRTLVSSAALTLLIGAAAGPVPLAAAPAPPALVTVNDFAFTPASITVPAGSTVTWTNHDDEPHSVVSAAGAFRSGALDTNESFSFRFERPGTYRYACSIHPRMVGTIVVE